VFLARALVSNPTLLLLDEPTSGVDIKTRDEVMHLLHELNHTGITVVMTTHEINAVAAHLPWLVCLNGHVLAEGPPSRVISPEILRMTYGAEMPVIQHQGMALVAESPHFFGRNGQENGAENRLENDLNNSQKNGKENGRENGNSPLPGRSGQPTVPTDARRESEVV
jgi:ABC-type cobalamin/Fe3+-siderophores transport system ATPase subunit